jgi:hypothetical protein
MEIAAGMNVPPNYLLGLSAGESNWGRPQGQNNLFGFSNPSTGKAYDYPSAMWEDLFRGGTSDG